MNNITCNYCGAVHNGTVCPRVKAFDYHPDGTLARVEFFAPKDYPPLIAGPSMPKTTT